MNLFLKVEMKVCYLYFKTKCDFISWDANSHLVEEANVQSQQIPQSHYMSSYRCLYKVSLQPIQQTLLQPKSSRVSSCWQWRARSGPTKLLKRKRQFNSDRHWINLPLQVLLSESIFQTHFDRIKTVSVQQVFEFNKSNVSEEAHS